MALSWVAPFAQHFTVDTVTVLRPECAFDAEADLGRVVASTLVLGGTTDAFYSEELFRRTADGISGGRAVLFPGKSHMYVAGSAVPAAVALGFLVG
jgi:hypothetical protein